MLGKQYQAKVKNADGVLVGVSQIRCGKPSVRAAGTAEIKAVRQVPDSTLSTVTGTDGATSVTVVVPSTTLTSEGTTSTLTASGLYTGNYDGAFIVRVKTVGSGAAATVDIFGPNGYHDANVSAPFTNYNMKLASATTSGVILNGNVTVGAVVGHTFIIPVWSGSAKTGVQTGIICPYSLFSSDNESVGGLRSSSFSPKVDDVKILSSGFPETEDSRIVAKTSVEIAFEALEYTNTNMANLKSIADTMINSADSPSIAIEVVMRTRGGSLVTFWCPSCAVSSIPSYAPQQDFSGFSWSLAANKMTEISGETVAYNTWLSRTNIYYELTYLH